MACQCAAAGPCAAKGVVRPGSSAPAQSVTIALLNVHVSINEKAHASDTSGLDSHMPERLTKASRH
jgi:hypothetical protein